MSNIIYFPGNSVKEPAIPLEIQPLKPIKWIKTKGFLRSLVKFAWVITAMTWPITRWFIYLDLFFVFLKMVFHTSPHAGLVFMLHGAIATAIAGFVICYRPYESPLSKKQTKNNRATGDKRKRCSY